MQDLTPEIKAEILDRAQETWNEIGRDCLIGERDYGESRSAEFSGEQVAELVIDRFRYDELSLSARQWWFDWAGTPEKKALMREAFPDRWYGL